MIAALDNQKKNRSPRRWHKPIDEVRRLAGPAGGALSDDDLYRLDQSMYAIAKTFVKQRTITSGQPLLKGQDATANERRPVLR